MTSKMKADSRASERPSLLSKRVLRTNKVNSNEAVKLQDRLRDMEGRQRQRQKNHAEEVQGIKTNLSQVLNVKEKMEISPVRRKFLLDHGVKLQVRDVFMEDFITAIDNSLQKPESMVFLSNKGEYSTVNSDAESNSSIPELRANDNAKSTSKSSLFCEDNFPLHLPVNMLRKKSKLKMAFSDSVESLVDDGESSREETNVGRMSQAGSSKKFRPFSGKIQSDFQFRVITPPLKGRQMVEVYKDMEEEEKLVQKLLEKKKFHDRLKKEEASKKKSSHAITNRQKKADYHGKKGMISFINKKDSDNYLYGDDNDVGGKEEDNSTITSARTEEEESNLLMEASPNTDYAVTNQRRRNSDTVEEFEKLMQKSLQLKLEKKQKSVFGSAATDQLRPKSTPNVRQGLSLDHLKRSTEKTRNSDRKTRHLSATLTDNVKEANSYDELLEKEPKSNNLSSNFDVEKWNNLVSRIKDDLKERKSTRPVTASKAMVTKSRISRISHPTAVDMDEDIIYDARPEKSVAKGYATMHMTVGKRSVSICVPRFKNEAVCTEQIASRAHAKSEMNVEQVREKKEKKSSKKQRTTSFD